jgi:glycosyltransferase involved in cell wall biosynthesis
MLRVTRPDVTRPDVTRPHVTLVVPALNEERNLLHVLPRVPAVVDELIVVDGGSHDGTVEVVRRLRPDARVVRQAGTGKGDALAAGFAAARGELIVIMDADASHDPAEIAAFVAALEAGADYAKGSRFIAGGGSADLTVVRRIGNRILRGLVNALYGTRYSDLCYGFNAVRAARLARLDVGCEGFEVEALLSCQVARAGLAVTEVASFESRRLYGTSNLRPLRDGLRIVRIVVRERLRRLVAVEAERETEPVAAPLAEKSSAEFDATQA